MTQTITRTELLNSFRFPAISKVELANLLNVSARKLSTWINEMSEDEWKDSIGTIQKPQKSKKTLSPIQLALFCLRFGVPKGLK